MKKLFMGIAALVVAVMLGHGAQAADAGAIKAPLMVARENAVAFIGAADAATQDKHVAEIVKASKAVDDATAAALADKATPADVAAKLKEFQATYEAFKKTRDGEIVPMVRAGKKDEAKALISGIQAERFKKMTGLLAELGAK